MPAGLLVEHQLLLIGLLALLGCLRAAAGRVGLGFLLGGVLLGIGLVLLGLALIDQVVTTGDGSDRFLRLTLDVFHGALDAFCGPTVLVSHNSPLRWADLLGVLPWTGYTGLSPPAQQQGFPLCGSLNAEPHSSAGNTAEYLVYCGRKNIRSPPTRATSSQPARNVPRRR